MTFPAADATNAYPVTIDVNDDTRILVPMMT